MGDSSDYKLFVMHTDGFAEISKEDFEKANHTINLEKWGRIEGYLQIGSQPGKNKNIALSPIAENIDWGQPYATFDYRAATDEQGKFVFENVQAGNVSVYRSIRFAIRPNELMSQPSQGQRIEIEPGKTATVILGGTGQPVVRKLTPAGGFEEEPNWNFCIVTAIPYVGPMPKEYDGLEKTIPEELHPHIFSKDWETLMEDWCKTTEDGKRYAAIRKTHAEWSERYLAALNARICCAVDETGGFRLEDVTAGQWEITARVLSAISELAPPPPRKRNHEGDYSSANTGR